MTYQQKYDKLLQDSILLFGGLFFMGIVDATSTFFTITGISLYVIYRKFIINFEIPCLENFKEKAEFIGRTNNKSFGVYIGKGMNNCIEELNLWIHLAVLIFGCSAFFIASRVFLINSLFIIILSIFSVSILTLELIKLRNLRIAIMAYSIVVCLIIITLIDTNVKTYEDACLKVALIITVWLILLCFVVSFIKKFAQVQKNSIYLDLRLPDKNTNYCIVFFKDGSVIEFNVCGFYPIVSSTILTLCWFDKTTPIYYRLDSVKSVIVRGQAWKSGTKEFILYCNNEEVSASASL